MKKQELSRKIYNDKTIKTTQRKMKLLGFNKGMDPIKFLNLILLLYFLLFYILHLLDIF